MRLAVTITHVQTATIEVGDLSANLIRDLLAKNDGTFDGNWALGDVSSDEKWTVTGIDVVEVEKAKGK